MDWLAHSAKGGTPSQTYGDHVQCALDKAREIASSASLAFPQSEAFTESVCLAAEFHDLGKLDDDNQVVLSSPTGKPLPREHVDAGTKHLFGLGMPLASYAGMIAYSHHRGLPDVPEQKERGSMAWRSDESTQRFNASEVVARTRACLPDYLRRHHEALDCQPTVASATPFKPSALDLRLALSCLAEADHGDTARHYGTPPIDAPLLHAAARLEQLDTYVSNLKSGNTDREIERAANRSAHYEACRAADTTPSLIECDSPVGSGKTTAVMAHLLRAAHAKNLRRVIVVQPFTNIINQSVNTYRKALILEGEAPDHVVAAHHHKTDFADPMARALTTRWHAPIVVTTAVQFFETLASNQPASLRKLHQVARSAIFIDEAHTALPAHLWPLAWKWLRQLAEHWGCHIVLASGSLARFWTLEEFYPKPLKANARSQTRQLPPLLGSTQEARTVRTKLGIGETRRIRFRQNTDRLTLNALLDFLATLPGPRITVFNTVQTAAIVALTLANRVGRGHVEHLSTALNPSDREKTLARIKERLANKSDTNWTLIATSLVEAGVDFSFRSGIRESSGLPSLLQLGGRVNRHDEYEDAEVWSVTLLPGNGICAHQFMKIPAIILARLFKYGEVNPDACTRALKLEVREEGNPALVTELFNMDSAMQYSSVAEKFQVIASDTVTVLTPGPFLDAIKSGTRPDWKSLQSSCVQIWATKKIEFGLTPIETYPGLYAWDLAYDNFIGYMAGALEAFKVKSGAIVIV